MLALEDEDLEALWSGHQKVLSPRVRKIVAGSYHKKSESEIRSSGYVIHTLEAALWSFQRTETFRNAILTAAKSRIESCARRLEVRGAELEVQPCDNE